MDQSLWSQLDADYSRHPILFAGPVAPEEIKKAERTLGRRLDPDHAEFIRRYGAGVVGAWPVLGIGRAEVMGDDLSSVIDVTKRYWAEGWPGTQDWYIVSADHAGNPIGIDTDGRVWISDHDFGGVAPMAATFEEFLADRMQGK